MKKKTTTKKTAKKRAPKKPIEIVRTPLPSEVMQQVVLSGDLTSLPPEGKVAYYRALCESVGLNPLSNPFGYIILNGKMTLYAQKGAAEQLRKIHGISIAKVEYQHDDECYRTVAYGEQVNGRRDQAVGIVAKPQSANDRANAEMKSETKAKRRLTLSMIGLGLIDQSELESMQGYQFVDVDATGNVQGVSKPKVVELPPGTNKKILAMPAEVKSTFNQLIKTKEYGKSDVAQMGIRLDWDWSAMEQEAKNLLDIYHAKRVAS